MRRNRQQQKRGDQMPLIDVMTGKRMSKVPHEAEYRRVMARLTAREIHAMKAWLNKKIDDGDIL